MKKIVLLFLLIIPLYSSAQKVEMIDNWKEAKELATSTEKNILVILTGSEWCAPCKKMDRNVIENKEFEIYANKNLVIFIIDLPGGGIIYNSDVHTNYRKFKEKYDAHYLPSLILTDKDGKKLKNLTGKMFRLENVMDQLKEF